jgi:hypothetical protein
MMQNIFMTHSKWKKSVWNVFFVFAGSTMIAHGARMMVQGLFYPTSIYPAPVPTKIDFWFDWMALAILGTIMFIFGLWSFYKTTKQGRQALIPGNYEPCIT